MTAQTPSARRRFGRIGQFGRLDLASFALIVVIGILRLPQAFNGDQALFTVGAAKMAKGALYYRDFWDI